MYSIQISNILSTNNYKHDNFLSLFHPNVSPYFQSPIQKIGHVQRKEFFSNRHEWHLKRVMCEGDRRRDEWPRLWPYTYTVAMLTKTFFWVYLNKIMLIGNAVRCVKLTVSFVLSAKIIEIDYFFIIDLAVTTTNSVTKQSC